MRQLAALAAVVASIVAIPGGFIGATAACAADENRFAIVVDFGDAPGAPSGNTVTCVPVDENDTAADALATRARMLGKPGPRYNNAGLLCSLDGYPESGCGDRTEAGYRYWSYWFGGDGWSYASTGPAFHRAKPGGVIGWRFQPSGTATASDPPPRASARFSDLCPPARVASTPPTTTARPQAPAPTPAPTTAAPASAPTSTAPPTSTTASSVPDRSTTTSIPEDEPAGQVAVGGDEGEGGGGSSWPVAAGGLGLAVAVGGAAVVRSRRR